MEFLRALERNSFDALWETRFNGHRKFIVILIPRRPDRNLLNIHEENHGKYLDFPEKNISRMSRENSSAEIIQKLSGVSRENSPTFPAEILRHFQRKFSGTFRGNYLEFLLGNSPKLLGRISPEFLGRISRESFLKLRGENASEFSEQNIWNVPTFYG